MKVSITFVNASKTVFQDGELVDLSKLFENRPQVFLLQVTRNLTHKELQRVCVLHGDAQRGVRTQGIGANRAGPGLGAGAKRRALDQPRVQRRHARLVHQQVVTNAILQLTVHQRRDVA